MSASQLRTVRPGPEEGYLLTSDTPPKLKIESHAAKNVALYLTNIAAYDINSATWALWSDTHWHRLTDNSKAKRLIAKQVELGTEPRGHSNRYVNAIMENLETLDRLPIPELQTGVVPFQNGLLDVSTGELKPAAPDCATDYVLPHSYDPLAQCETIKSWLTMCVDDDGDTVQVLRAWCAALVRGIPVQKILILRGLGGTGKGTFQRLVVALVGAANTATSKISDLENNRFELAKHFDKRLCLINEAGKYAGELNMLKSMTGGDWLPLERKNQQQTGGFQYRGAVLISTNDDILASDSGTERRKITARFDKRPSAQELQRWNDAGGEESVLHREIPGFIRWLLELSEAEIQQLLETLSPRIIADNRLSMRSGNSVADWMIEHCMCDPLAATQIGRWKPGDHEASLQLYPNYREWCEETGRKPAANNTFANKVIEVAADTGHVVSRQQDPDNRRALLVGIRLAKDSETYFGKSAYSSSSNFEKAEGTEGTEGTFEKLTSTKNARAVTI